MNTIKEKVFSIDGSKAVWNIKISGTVCCWIVVDSQKPTGFQFLFT